MEFPSFNFEKAQILVIGDVMLDQYWHGGTSRISPEAPVPVVHVNHVDERPGGAANVALNVAALGANPYLLGLIGADHAGHTLEQLLVKQDIAYHFETVPHHSTITKLRVLSRNQQMIRLDMEKSFASDVSSLLSLEEQYSKALENINIVLLSDYGKGTLAKSVSLIAAAREKNIPVVVDPKSSDFSIYRGATIITPNFKEFEAVAGPCPTIEIMVEKARRLLMQHAIEALVITRSEHGLSIVLANGEVTHIPAVARVVHDVTGAGDTVIAVLAAALASGMDIIKAATLGNIAAGIVVGKLGAETVTVQELHAALEEETILPLGVISKNDLLAAVRMSKAKGEKIVFTNGCFDILHAGHVMYLEQAKRLGDRVIVAVNDNESVARLKGPTRPVNSVEERMQVLAGLRSVDWVVSFSEDTPENMIQSVSPHIMVKGGDYKDIEALPGAKFVLSQGGSVQILDLKEGCSTTRVIEQMRTPQTVANAP